VKPTKRHLLFAAALLASMLSPALVAACGGSASSPKAPAASPDPFVGTWSDPGGQVPSTLANLLVVAKRGSGYEAAFLEPSPTNHRTPILISLTRQGNRLAGGFMANGKLSPVVVDHLPATGHIAFIISNPGAGGAMIRPEDMTKVSEATAIPTPSP
jgi:hypothetical protein